MKIVVDTNIIFSALLDDNSKFWQILLKSDNNFIAPLKTLKELMSKVDKMLKYTKVDTLDFTNLLFEILSRVNFINENLIPEQIYDKAEELCNDYDEDDIPFVALALHYDAYYWTGDKIKEHLKAKGFDKIFEY